MIMAWKEGMFMFNKENIEVVTRQIEQLVWRNLYTRSKTGINTRLTGISVRTETLESH